MLFVLLSRLLRLILVSTNGVFGNVTHLSVYFDSCHQSIKALLLIISIGVRLLGLLFLLLVRRALFELMLSFRFGALMVEISLRVLCSGVNAVGIAKHAFEATYSARLRHLLAVNASLARRQVDDLMMSFLAHVLALIELFICLRMDLIAHVKVSAPCKVLILMSLLQDLELRRQLLKSTLFEGILFVVARF